MIDDLLKTCGEIERSSPDADRSPTDISPRCCGVVEAIDDVRRVFSFKG